MLKSTISTIFGVISIIVAEIGGIMFGVSGGLLASGFGRCCIGNWYQRKKGNQWRKGNRRFCLRYNGIDIRSFFCSKLQYVRRSQKRFIFYDCVNGNKAVFSTNIRQNYIDFNALDW